MPGAVPTPPAETRVAPAEVPGLSGLMTVVVGVVIVAALYIGRDVFIPIVLAILLSFVLAPLVSLLRRIHVPRAPAVVLAVLFALTLMVAAGGIIGLQVAQLAEDVPRYQATITSKVDHLRDVTLGRVNDLIRRVGRQIEQATNEQPPASPATPSATGEAAPPPLPVEVKERAATPVEIAQRVLGPVVHPLATAGIVLIVAIFILLQREDLRDRLIRLFGSQDLHRTTVAMDDAARRLSRYFLTQLALNTAFGVVIGLGLWAIGVPSPILWGVFSGLMRFVPYIGALVSAVFPIALAAAVDPSGWSMALWTLALFAVTEPLMGHVVEPMVYGHSTGLSPFAVIISAIFWTWLWGPIGLLLSTPFTVVLVVLGRHVERLEFLDVLFGDRPALTPVESFYQRMLAGDSDEALEHAELLLKERSLSAYYDEVALKGLQLAANDATRGVLTRPQLETIRGAIRDLVEDLEDQEDVSPPSEEADAAPVAPPRREREIPAEPPLEQDERTAEERFPPQWRQDGAILCIAGRGTLDEGAAAMLAQLLRKHGLGARVVPHEAVSRDNIRRLDTTGVTMVCISYLEISGSPAHLRYLLRRLRQKLPRAPLLVGLWPREDAILTDAALRSQVGADHYVVSLREALRICMEAADAAASAEPIQAPAPAVEMA
ncbi:AI-2E family transporter [Enterovirga aerilata]|uniref:AI-2E family transporter n=1 Tax=Enterovirga aerilata TaxID=2730920 RepID=A0A849I5Z9_9HYPH|nr:AI-2E family transporter [Enterovirga sp. DB1703]NNM71755.1 AI-2E family transporter [Enterovirga sp. DB1703]